MKLNIKNEHNQTFDKISNLKIGTEVKLVPMLNEINTGVSTEDLYVLYNNKIYLKDYYVDENKYYVLGLKDTDEYNRDFELHQFEIVDNKENNLNNKGVDNMSKVRGFEIVREDMRKTSINITLPTRGSKTSAGYDFYSTETFTLKSNESKLIWTDVKAYMQVGEVLNIYVRSSIGIKKSLTLKNFTGIIDQDYFENENNDGNIGICLYNYGDKEVTIEEGERIAQGIFMNFLEADNGNTNKVRVGGVGSTGTK